MSFNTESAEAKLSTLEKRINMLEKGSVSSDNNANANNELNQFKINLVDRLKEIR